jgi:tetratricopeptide (TPR) repeat protein
LVVALVFAAPLAAQQRGDLNAAIELERQGRNAEAADRFIRVLTGEPANLAALLGLERTLHAAGQLERALPYVDAALAERPEENAVWALHLRMFTSLGRHGEAVAVGARWVAAHPDAVEAYRDWAFAAAARGDLREARRVLEMGRARLGVLVLVQELAQVNVVGGQWLDAARHWHEAARADEGMAAAAGMSLSQAPPPERERVLRQLIQELGDPVARRIAADLLVAWDQPDQAWSLLDANLPADPHTAAAALRRFADRARLVGTRDGARARAYALERLAGLGAGGAAQQARIEAARAFAEAGDRAGAERMLDRIGRDPNAAPPAAVDAMAALISVTADAGRVQEAARQLDAWGGRFAADVRGGLRERIAWAWIRRGELDRASQALGDDSTVATVAIHGWLALFRGDFVTAVAQFRVAGPYSGSRTDATKRTGLLALLQRLPFERSPELGTALLTLERGDTTEAIARLARIAGQLPAGEGRADLLAHAGQLATEHGDRRAEPLLREAIATDSLGPSAPAAELALAELLWRRGQPAEALARLEHLILAYPESAVIAQARRLMDRVRGGVPNS